MYSTVLETVKQNTANCGIVYGPFGINSNVMATPYFNRSPVKLKAFDYLQLITAKGNYKHRLLQVFKRNFALQNYKANAAWRKLSR